MQIKRFISQPLLFPIIFFGLAILLGSFVLCQPVSLVPGQSLKWTDALFTATSATCVTGLTVVDTGSVFSSTGKLVVLFLIQIGGLGIMSLTSLAFYLFRQRITLTDRIAVGQNLLQNPRFHLGTFLLQIVLLTLSIELIGAVLLYYATDGKMSFVSAIFHSVSAFCNAGFALYNDSLTRFVNDVPVMMIFVVLITLGGIGFFVMLEVGQYCLHVIRKGFKRSRLTLSWYSTVVLQTSLYLTLGGTLALFVAEMLLLKHDVPWDTVLLASFFQAVSCRTAGFNSVSVVDLTNVSLLLMMGMMFVGAAPGSCGGGIKVTTFRVLLAFVKSELCGRKQSVIGRMAVTRNGVQRAMSLFIFSAVIVSAAILVLSITEHGGVPHSESRDKFLEIAFEVVSAFGTAGISAGLSAELSETGKYIIMLLMFCGRLGPLLFLGALQAIQRPELFTRPESDLLIG